jgi:signal transduction histidine kinase
MTASSWRRFFLAVLPVAVLGALALALVELAGDAPGLPDADAPGRTSGALVAVVLLTVAPLALRYVAPVLVLACVVALTIVTPAGEPASFIQALGAAVASYTVGARIADRLRSAVLVVGVAVLATVGALVSGGDLLRSLVLPFVVLVPSWLLGDAVRARRTEAQRRQEDARRARRELELELRSAAEAERRQVARELHDIVAHTVSVMVVQAGAARKVVQRSPERADGALAAVETTGREAMAELRRFFGALDGEPDGEDALGGLAPQPRVASVAELVERVRQAGLTVRLEVDGSAPTLPASVEAAAYRIVQEALTNALRYADGAPTVVHLGYEASQLRIEVIDEGPATEPATAQGAGRGLVGMRERAKLVGGRLEAGPRAAGGFAVKAWLPVGMPS